MQYRGESPDSAAALSASKELVLELMEMVYRHSLEKFTSRVNKRYSKFQDWFKELSAYVEKQDLNQLPDSHLWDDLQCVAIGLEEVEELLRAHTATTLPFIELIETMSILAESIHKLVRSRSVLAWPLLVPDAKGNVFPLERYLRKLIGLQSHCYVLAKYAHSPRLRWHFYDKTFTVEAVTSTPRTVNKPQPSLENVIANVLSDQKVDPTILKAYLHNTSDPFRNKDSVKAPVHCECALIDHFNKPAKSDTTEIPPVGYLGVSKLSCSACKIFIDVWNQNNPRGQSFLTRGSHGKCYFPWALPPSLNKATVNAFVASITDYIAKSLKEAGIVGRLGESSSPSSDSDDSSFPILNRAVGGEKRFVKLHSKFPSKSGKSVAD